MHEGDRMRRAFDNDPVVMLKAGKGLHIKIDANVAAAHDFDHDFTAVGDDDRTIR